MSRWTSWTAEFTALVEAPKPEPVKAVRPIVLPPDAFNPYAKLPTETATPEQLAAAEAKAEAKAKQNVGEETRT